MQRRLNLVYRLIRDSVALDARFKDVVRPFLITEEDPRGVPLESMRVRIAWVPPTAAIVHAAYPAEWLAAKLPEPAKIVNVEAFLRQHIGSAGTVRGVLGARDRRIAAETISRAFFGGSSATCPGCGTAVPLEQGIQHMRECAQVRSPLSLKPHKIRRHSSPGEETQRRRMLKTARKSR